MIECVCVCVCGGGGDVTECIVYMFRPRPYNLFFPVLFLFDWVGFLWPNYLSC